ncbi:MAG TPA: trypco2 family protein [Kribbella sp.]|nr:trypco2 family protein [Kribbella sp.]
MEKVGLAETVEAVRQELAIAVARAADAGIRFPVGEVRLEFQVGVTKAAEGSAGVKFWVAELGAGTSYANESLQKVTITLGAPVDRAGRRVLISEPDEQPD